VAVAQSIAENVAIALRVTCHGLVTRSVTATQNFPYIHGAVPAGGGEPAATGAEVHVGNQLVVSRERDTSRRFIVVRQGGGVPDANRLIVAGGSELVAVVIECNIGEGAPVGEDPEHLPTGGSVQDRQGAIP